MSAVQELLDRKKIPYILKGSDFVVHCRNPEHDDSSPSMRINNITGIYNCFSCGWKGNIMTDFNEKVGGIQMKRDKLLQQLTKVKIDSIGLKIPEGAIPWDTDFRGISKETLQKVGAFRYQAEFANRIIFPIKDFSGKIKVFHGRHLDMGGTPKYLNHPTGVELPMYPHRPKIHHGRIVLVEGIFDWLNLYDKGLTNVIAAFGLQNFNVEKLSLLKMLGVTGIDIFMDDDSNKITGKNPGQEAALKLREMIDDYGMSTVNIAFKGKDPGDLTKNQVTKLKEQLYG